MKCKEPQKIIGVIYVPPKEKYMCLSIRRYYVAKQFIRHGATKEQAEELAIKTVS